MRPVHEAVATCRVLRRNHVPNRVLCHLAHHGARCRIWRLAGVDTVRTEPALRDMPCFPMSGRADQERPAQRSTAPGTTARSGKVSVSTAATTALEIRVNTPMAPIAQVSPSTSATIPARSAPMA